MRSVKFTYTTHTWLAWLHQRNQRQLTMTASNGKFPALLALCAGNSPHKYQWRGALMFSTNNWANNGDTGDLRRYRAHYDVIVMFLYMFFNHWYSCVANIIWTSLHPCTSDYSTHLPLVQHECDSYLNQCWIIDWTLRNKLQLNFIKKVELFI